MLKKLMKSFSVAAIAGMIAVLSACGSEGNPFNGTYEGNMGGLGQPSPVLEVDGLTVTMWREGKGNGEPHSETGSYLEVETYKNGDAKTVTIFDERDKEMITLEDASSASEGAVSIKEQGMGMWEPLD